MPYESRTLPVVVIPPCYRYTNRPGLPVFPGCQLPSGYSRALNIVVTTLLCLVLDSNQSFCFCSVLPLHQLSIYREKGVRSPVCLRASLVPIFYHTIAVYSLPRETVIQGPLDVGDCYLGIIRIQTTSTGLSPAETITLPNPSSVFLLYANYGFLYTVHQPYLFLTYNSTSINWIYLSGLVLSPLRTTSHIVLEDILLSLHSHAIDNEHSALVLWTYNLFDCRQLLPPTSRLVASMSGLANNCSITTLYARFALALWRTRLPSTR